MDKVSLEAEISLQIAKAKQLICHARNSVSTTLLEKLEQDIRAAFLSAMSENLTTLSSSERIRKIQGRQKWEDAKALTPNITPVSHIMETYPDRRELGMLRRDLKEEGVDPQLYRALYYWLSIKKDGSRNTLPFDFDLPTKSQATDLLLDELYATSKSLTSAMTPSDARMSRAVSARHSRSYRSRTSIKKVSPRLAAE